MPRLEIRMRKETKNGLREMCKELDVTMKHKVVDLIEREIKRFGRQK